LPKFILDLYYKNVDAVRKWFVSNGMLADHTGTPKESKALTSARDALKAAESDLKSRSKALTAQEEDLGKDYGVDDIFRALKDQCTTIDSGEYTYELCWFGKTSQKSKKGHGNTNMGDFASIDHEMADEEERHDGKGLGVVERGPLVDLALLDGGEQQADRRQARGIAAAHRRLHVLGDPCLQVHVRLLGCPAPPRGEHGAAPSPLIAGADAKSPLRAGLSVAAILSRLSRRGQALAAFRGRGPPRRWQACRHPGGPGDQQAQ